MTIRTAKPSDLAQVIAIESACFPPEEAATPQALAERLAILGDSFLVAELGDGSLIGLVNGSIGDSPVILDEMFRDIGKHQPMGPYQYVFGLDVLPEYRGLGLGSRLLRHLEARARAAGRKAVVLTCKEGLLAYYGRLGYVNQGVSASTHGGATWHDLRLDL